LIDWNRRDCLGSGDGKKDIIGTSLSGNRIDPLLFPRSSSFKMSLVSSLHHRIGRLAMNSMKGPGSLRYSSTSSVSEMERMQSSIRNSKTGLMCSRLSWPRLGLPFSAWALLFVCKNLRITHCSKVKIPSSRRKIQSLLCTSNVWMSKTTYLLGRRGPGRVVVNLYSLILRQWIACCSLHQHERRDPI